MDDLDRLLAESMHQAAEKAPSDGGLLTTVHQKSRRYHRRRVATGLSTAAVAVLALGIPLGTALVTRSLPAGPAAGPGPVATSEAPTVSSPAISAPVATTPTSPPPFTAATRPATTSTVSAVRLTGGVRLPTFPYTLPAAAGLKAPVASIRDGNLIAFFEATDLREHADTTVTVSTRRPAFTGSATTRSMAVRRHTGTLRTVDVQPAKQLTLFWPESPTRWITLATDDTYTPAQVVALANSLSAAAIAVLPPFTLDLAPQGLAVDTVTASTMSFRTADANRIEVVLRKHRQLSGTTDQVGRYRALLRRNAAGTTLSVDVTDWDATLDVTVDAGLTMTRADLLRFASGVHILNRSDPGEPTP